MGENIRRERIKKRLSQQQLADMLFVERSTCSNWESGRRSPDAAMVFRIAECLGISPNVLVDSVGEPVIPPTVIMVDDEQIVLSGSIPVLKRVLPGAEITGFTKPTEALHFAETTAVDLAFLDVEMGKTSGLTLCQELLRINPKTNVIFLTAYMDYSFDAWNTGACGFLLKPISPDTLNRQLAKLRYPLQGGDKA